MSGSQQHRLRFSLRTFLLLSVLGTLVLGVFLRSVKQQRDAVALIREHGGTVQYDYEVTRHGEVATDTVSWVPNWLLRWVSKDAFHAVTRVNLVYDDATRSRLQASGNDDVLHAIGRIPSLRVLLLRGSQAHDSGLRHIANLKRLERLYMWDATRTTDDGVIHLRGLKHLQYIHISNSRMRDDSLRYLSELPRLEGLSIQGNKITDTGLSHVGKMHALRELWIGFGEHTVSNNGLAHLRQLQYLQHIDLQGIAVTDDGLSHLASLPNLKCLLVHRDDLQNANEVERLLPECKVEFTQRRRPTNRLPLP